MATARSGADTSGVRAPEVRAPRPDELERLRDVERAAGRAFADIGMGWVAAHAPPSIDELEAFRAAGRAWVVVVPGVSAPAGYVLVEDLDEPLAAGPGVAAHVEQVSVDPAHAHRRLGRLLIEHVAADARGRGVGDLTLTTFREVPWNAPYYERCGFRALAERELGPGLLRVRAVEASHGLAPATRVCMHRRA